MPAKPSLNDFSYLMTKGSGRAAPSWTPQDKAELDRKWRQRKTREARQEKRERQREINWGGGGPHLS